MKQPFLQIKENKCDAICIMPSPDSREQTIIHGLTYVDNGDNIGSSTMGNSYDIVTFRESDEGFYDKEHYQAILVCPYTYSEKVMKDGFFGIIAKRTTTSEDVLNLYLNKIDYLIGDEDVEQK
jgi:hypothetical protein